MRCRGRSDRPRSIPHWPHRTTARPWSTRLRHLQRSARRRGRVRTTGQWLPGRPRRGPRFRVSATSASVPVEPAVAIGTDRGLVFVPADVGTGAIGVISREAGNEPTFGADQLVTAGHGNARGFALRAGASLHRDRSGLAGDADLHPAVVAPRAAPTAAAGLG